jgi:hypothetical protein
VGRRAVRGLDLTHGCNAITAAAAAAAPRDDRMTPA